MISKYILVKPTELTGNFISMIGYDSMLFTAGNIQSFNTMTAGWGGIGYLWQKPVVFTYIRPTRFTYQFAEKNEFFTLCFFDKKHKEILHYCGSNSGKDVDKIKETGLVPFEMDGSSVAFIQSKLVLLCRKIYFDDIKPSNFKDNHIEKHYPLKDYHRMYVGEIVKCYVEK